MGRILGADIQFAQYLKTVTVELPEYECAVILRQLNCGQSLTLDPKNIVLYVAMMIVDENGNRVFTTDEDLANLANMSSLVFDRILTAANELNAASEKAMETTVKNSPPSLSEVSVSA
jgi:hypothetical protein